ncbi:MAG: nitroreductase family protein [Gaiellaceae bacterium]|jgi:nitroreductase
MDAFLAIASKRDVRDYADTPIPDDVVTRILDAGRLAGSALNRQEWEFVVVSDQAALAEAVFAPQNVRTATLVVAIVGTRAFDLGRCAQNMMLAAWNDGVVSCPNGVKDADEAARIVGGQVGVILSFGYPARPRNPESRTAEEWSTRAKRKPLDELVRRI